MTTEINVVIKARGAPNDSEALRLQLQELLKDFNKRFMEVFFSQSIRQDGPIEVEIVVK